MNRIGLLTFHSPRNYGSMLQAYALQREIIAAGFLCDIIDFRPPAQHIMYKEIYERGGFLKRIVKWLICFPYVRGLRKKASMFDEFLSRVLILSPHVNRDTISLLNGQYDVFVCGSDQIWNVQCQDFDWLYYLTFADEGKLISYAPSMGPNPVDRFSVSDTVRISLAVSRFRSLSVREKEAADYISELIHREVPVMLDPTLLLARDEWSKMAGDKPLIEEPYILVYTPTYHAYIYEYAEFLGSKMDMKVVVTQFNDMGQLRSCRKSIFKLDTGPIEFLNLCKYATLVCTGSFHAVVFSIIFHKDFISVYGDRDSRIKTLLENVSIDGRYVDLSKGMIVPSLKTIDYDAVDIKLQRLRESSLDWLFTSIRSVVC